MSENSKTPYPVQLNIDYPDRKLNRLTSFFRLFTVLPILFLLILISGSQGNWDEQSKTLPFVVGGLLCLPVLLMLLFRRKYPRWWFDWNISLYSFSFRVASYMTLLTDVYPSTDEEQSVHLTVPYPDAKKDLNRWLPLVKWFLAIPHLIILALLCVGMVFTTIIAWFAILFTGRYPQGLFNYAAGVFRWGFRVGCYAFLLVTDVYPPFSLK